MTDALDTLSGEELWAASERADAALNAAFQAHIERVKTLLNLPGSFYNPEIRQHQNGEGNAIAGWTMLYWDSDKVRPVLIGTVVREWNHKLLCIVDRSGSSPVVHEHRFDTRDFIQKISADR